MTILGEGRTPMVRSFKPFHEGRLYFKLEHQNPTGTFKDRGTSWAIVDAFKRGFRSVHIKTTGNAGASAAAYAAKYGVELTAIIPNNIPREKLQSIQIYGAKTVYEGSSESKAIVSSNTSWSVGADNQSYMRGLKGIAQEILGVIYPEVPRVICPMGTGSLYVSIYEEMKYLVKLHGIPRVDCAQVDSVRSVHEQANGETDTDDAYPSSIASGLNVPRAYYAKQVSKALEENQGNLYSLFSKEILDAQTTLATSEGLAVEPSGAASYAAYIRGCKEGRYGDESVVVLLTGGYLKQLPVGV